MDEIEEIKRKIDIVSLISEYMTLKKAGRNFKGVCPFHHEKTPSFVVSPERQIWHCFGSCDDGGDIFKFLMKREGWEFGEALQNLAKRAGVVLKKYTPGPAEKSRERLLSANHLALEFYHYLLLNHASGVKALNYLKERGIQEETMRKFKIGFAPALWDTLVKFLTKKGFSEQEMLTAGLVFKRRNLNDLFRNRIMFPLIDHRGNVLGFAGRILPSLGEEGPKYFNTPETPVFHKSFFLYGLNLTKEAIKEKNQAILVEGEIDLLASFQAGVKNVAAVKGTALTEEQVQLLKRYTENVAICFDADLAGDSATKRGIQLADRAGMNIKVIQLKTGKDPDECIKKEPKLWPESIEGAIPIYDFYFKSYLTKFDPKTAEGKKKIGQELVPILAEISDEILRSFYIKKLADNLEVSEEAVGQAVKAKLPTNQISREKGEIFETNKLKSRGELLEEYLIILILHWLVLGDSKEILTKLLKKIQRKYFSSFTLREVFGIIQEKYCVRDEKFSIERLVKEIPSELVPIVDRLYLYDFEKEDDLEFLIKEIKKIGGEMEKIWARRELKSLAERIVEAEKDKNEQELRRLREEFGQKSNILKGLKDD